jgi:hypothetical protein
MRILISYVFHQFNSNVETFVRRGLVANQDFTFVLIYNYATADDTSELISKHLSCLETYPNVHLLPRPNLGQDFGGWNDLFFLDPKSLDRKILPLAAPAPGEPYLYQSYDRYICLNSTVAGPYVPLYVDGPWPLLFTSPLSDQVKLVGITANFTGGQTVAPLAAIFSQTYGFAPPDTVHIQSMSFGTDRSGLNLLIAAGLFQAGRTFPSDKLTLIGMAEIGMSALFRRAGFSLYSFLPEQGLIPPTRIDTTDNYWSLRRWSPLMETMFVKTMDHLIFPEKIRYDRLSLPSPSVSSLQSPTVL